jgi:hypothetical protein
MHKLLLLALALPLSGCFLTREMVNEPIAPASVEAVAKLTPHHSTQSDALALLGAPEQVVELYKRSAWLYRHVESKRVWLWLGPLLLTNVDEQSDRVWCFFDEEGRYVCSGASLRAESAEFTMPWTDPHTPEDE